jgi:AcrR family transcriptional regulator
MRCKNPLGILWEMADSPRPYHHGELRAALLVGGKALLEELGPDGFSLRELARRVNVSAMAPYRHFADKEALLATLAADGFARLAGDIEATTGEPAERLRNAARKYVSFARTEPTLFRLMFSPLISHPVVEPTSLLAFDRLMVVAQPLHPTTRLLKDKVRFATAIWSGLHGIATIGNDGVGGLYDSGVFVEAEEMVDALRAGWPGLL